MIRIAKILSLLVVLGLTSCFEEEVYPDQPEIEFQDLKFYDSPTTDSLVLTFTFRDGGANLGIQEDFDILPPFNKYNLFIDDNDTIITEDNLNLVNPPIYTVPLVLRSFIPIRIQGNTLFIEYTDSDYPLLLYEKEFFSDNVNDIVFECPGLINTDGFLFQNDDAVLYDIQEGGRVIEIDRQRLTGDVPAQVVESHFNFIITFEENIGGTYRTVDFQQIFGTEDCTVGNFSGRIPWYDNEGTSGTISYNMTSQAFKLAFQDKTIRIRFYVIDRLGLRSNEVVTSDFILSEITQ